MGADHHGLAGLYKEDGLLIINFDEADFDERDDRSPSGTKIMTEYGETCCDQKPGPNLGSFPQDETDRRRNL